LFVLTKIDEILTWQKEKETDRDTRFVELGRYLCEVRTGQSRVEIAERSHTAAGSGGRTLKDVLHLMVVILIQTTKLLGLLERCSCPST
jgi:hypothetical protein